MMSFMIGILGLETCELHQHPHVSDGILVCAAGCQHRVCRDCAGTVAKEIEQKRKEQYHEHQKRAGLN